MRIMISGGGTGGHTSPAVAIIEELQKRDSRLIIQWIGKRGGIEERVAANLGVPFRPIPVEGWPRGRSPRKVWTAFKLFFGLLRAAIYIRRFQPEVVIGVGGYVSLPLLLAAQWMNVATVIHEQNKRLGMANRMLAARARRLLLSFPDTLGDYPRERAAVVGNPVRAGFALPIDKLAARQKLGLDPVAPVVLITGGSQGAHTLNKAVAEFAPRLGHDEAQVIWMTGQHDFEFGKVVAAKATARVLVFAFIDDMVSTCAAADVIVGRSGASSTAELAVMGKPAILVPYPHATDNHQEANATAFEDAGAAIVIADNDCTGDRLWATLQGLLADSERLQRMAHAASTLARPQAADNIVSEVLRLVFPANS